MTAEQPGRKESPRGFGRCSGGRKRRLHPPNPASVCLQVCGHRLAEGMLSELLGLQGWPLSRAELAASADSGTFPGLALRPIENSCFSWLAALWPASGPPWNDPSPMPLCDLRRIIRERDWRNRRPPCSAFSGSFLPPTPKVTSSRRAKPDGCWASIPDSSIWPLLLRFPDLEHPSVLALRAAFRVLLDVQSCRSTKIS